MALGDLDGDGNLDLAAASFQGGELETRLGRGDGTFGRLQDGQVDLVACNTGANTVSILLGRGNGTFQPHQELTIGRFPFGIALADINADGRLDLATVNQSSNALAVAADPVTDHLAVRFGRGDGTFEGIQRFGVATAPVGMIFTDLDGDDCLDVAVAALFGGVSVLLQDP